MISVFDMASGELLDQEFSEQRRADRSRSAGSTAPEMERQASLQDGRERAWSANLQLRLLPVESSGPLED